RACSCSSSAQKFFGGLNKSGKHLVQIERSKAVLPVGIGKQIRAGGSALDIIFYFGGRENAGDGKRQPPVYQQRDGSGGDGGSAAGACADGKLIAGYRSVDIDAGG